MTKINLRDYYPHYYKTDCIITVPDEVVTTMLKHDRIDAAYQRRRYYHNAHYSLDRDDGIEYEALFFSASPSEIYERNLTTEQIYTAMATLPDKQAKRIYAHYFLGLSMKVIAKSENVSVEAVSDSIQRGLRNLENILKKTL